MNLTHFQIGGEFWCSDRRWRCTDIGSRVVVAIRIDHAEVATLSDGEITRRTIDHAEAEAGGWFRGPPYGVAEVENKMIPDRHQVKKMIG